MTLNAKPKMTQDKLVRLVVTRALAETRAQHRQPQHRQPQHNREEDDACLAMVEETIEAQLKAGVPCAGDFHRQLYPVH